MFPGLAGTAGLAHGISGRRGGVSEGAFASLNLGRGTADDAPNVAENRRRAAQALGFHTICVPHQVHGAAIRRVLGTDTDPGQCDALSTDTPGVCIGVLGADCPGILLVDPVHRALAVVHAGWRGVAARIAPLAVEHLARTYGSQPGSLRVGIGPGISQENYEVDAATAEALAAALPEAPGSDVIRAGRPGHAHVGLVAAIESQLLACEVQAAHIERHAACTHEHPDLYSHRRAAGITGRHALLAGWLPN